MSDLKRKSNITTLAGLEKVALTPPRCPQLFKLAALLKMSRSPSRSSESQDDEKVFYLSELIKMEDKAFATQNLADTVAVWAIPYYAQRKYWFKLFIGFNYGLFSPLLSHWTLQGIPDPTFSAENVQIYQYLAGDAGLQSMESIFGALAARPARKLKSKTSLDAISQSRKGTPTKGRIATLAQSTSTISLKSKLSFDSFKFGFRSTSRSSDIGNVAAKAIEVEDELTGEFRQSKLSQEQLTELQRSTHFDKKELQQWYKGEFMCSSQSELPLTCA
jgi:hypothetical protein